MSKHVEAWHKTLPVHLGSIDPAILIPSYRRQAIVLKLAHAHAIMHANRLFLLRSPVSDYTTQIRDCIEAANGVLETVDYMAQDGPIFHAFWWTHYVTFCALVVTYVWEIKHRHVSQEGNKDNRSRLRSLAERCHIHLAQATASNSPSRRYAVILEEFRSLAINQAKLQRTTDSNKQTAGQGTPETPSQIRQGGDKTGTIIPNNSEILLSESHPASSDPESVLDVPLILDDWQLADWLDLDSSVSLGKVVEQKQHANICRPSGQILPSTNQHCHHRQVCRPKFCSNSPTPSCWNFI